MKQATCKELRGACSEVLKGETPEEMGLASRNHVMEQVQKGDKDHQKAVQEMMNLPKEDQEKWYLDFKDNFSSLQDAK